MDPARVRTRPAEALSAALSRSMRRPGARSGLPLLLRVCLDELSEVASCTELRAALLHEQVQEEGSRLPRAQQRIDDLLFAADEIRRAIATIAERVDPDAPSRIG